MQERSGTKEGTTSSGPRVHSVRPPMPIEGGSLHAWIADEIGQRIVRGEYPPGTILPNEAKWSETFKVSRSAVREAVKMLNAKSLLASRPKVGSRVEPRARWNLLDRDVLGWYASAPDGAGFLSKVQEFRHFVEPEAASLAALRRQAPVLAEMALSSRDMREAKSPEAWMDADIRFHLAILAGSGNDLLLPLGVIVEAGLRHIFDFFKPRDVNRHEIEAIHAAIERAIRLRRPDAARRAMRRLLVNTDGLIARKLAG